MIGSNPRKIAVISCVNNESQYAECLKFINALEVPAGFKIEPIAVRQVVSMSAGYNQAMSSTDSAFKVYLHQDVLILNRNFFIDLIKLFQDNTDIGLLGVVGAKTVPSSGVWWESSEKAGKIYDSISGKARLCDWGGINGALVKVQAVDGLLMATQYDIPWREDLFDGWHFYDTSQCMEFLRAGYQVAIPHQPQPWCWHDCNITPIDKSYHKGREVFCQNYLSNNPI